jgi:hypothetical protein
VVLVKTITKFIIGFIGFIIGTIIVAELLTSLDPFGVMHYPQTHSTTSTGWAKLQPISASIEYHGEILSAEIYNYAGVDRPSNNFQVTFQNAAGTSINITNVIVNETVSLTSCDDVTIKTGYIYSTHSYSNSWTPSMNDSFRIQAGDGFELTAFCPPKNDGDPFDLAITIDYTAVMGGISTVHTESGHIRGPAEE